MSNATNIKINLNTKPTEEVKTEMDDIAAFNADLHLAEYMERVERGELTEEEKACREAIRNFIGVK